RCRAKPGWADRSRAWARWPWLLLMISGDGFLPGFLLDDASILQYFARVLVEEILRVAGYGQVAAPGEHAIFQLKCRFGFALNSVRGGIGIGDFVRHLLKVRFFTPWIFAFRLAFPDHGCFLMSLVALQGPFARPGETHCADILSLF